MARINSAFYWLRCLPASERYILVQAALLLPFWWVRLKIFGPGKIYYTSICYLRSDNSCNEALTSGQSRPASDQNPIISLSELKRIGALVNIAAHHVLPNGNCLVRAVYLNSLLQRQGISTILRLGVRRADGHLLAHAWVEWTGHPLNEDDDVSQYYLPLRKSFSTNDRPVK